MSESLKPIDYQIGLAVNIAVTAGIHNNGEQRRVAIKRVAELLAKGGTPAITVFSEIQNRR